MFPFIVGVMIPDTRCGPQYILVQIDPDDQYTEVFDFNNVAALSVVNNCSMGKFISIHTY